MAATLTFSEIGVPMRRGFTTAAGSVSERRVILLGITRNGTTGWGEAAPYPGYTDDSIDTVWRALEAGTIDDRLPRTAAAALDEAAADLAAKEDGLPLWRAIGGSPAPLRASLALGIAPGPGVLVARVAEAAAEGYTSVKLKIRPGHDVAPVAAVREAFPDIAVCVDANGAYTLDDLPTLRRLDELGLTHIEQPFPAADIAAHARLRRELTTPICLDESVFDIDSVRRALARDAADVVTVKPGVTGIGPAVAIARAVVEAGVRLKASGLLETSIGRHHSLAVGTLPGFAFHDLSLPASTLADDVTTGALEITGGWVTPPAAAGIGVEPDPARLDELTIRRAAVSIAGETPRLGHPGPG